MADKPSEQKQRTTKGNKIVIIVSGVVIIALISVIAVLLLDRKEEHEPDEPKRNVVVNQNNAEEIATEMISQKYVEPGYYSASMTMEWHFETGDAISEDAYVANKIENTNDIYFDVFLADDETDPILQSPVIPRGSELDNISLDKPLDAGTYDCIMIYHLVDEEQNTVSTLRVRFTVIVEK